MKFRVVLLLVLLLFALGCSGDKKSAELLETARFEEKQNNLDHARQLYQEIVTRYPDSAAATTARGRLAELGK